MREHVAHEQPVYIPPSARQLGPDGVWTVDDSWSLSMSNVSTSMRSMPSTSAPGPSAGSAQSAPAEGDLSGMSGMSGISSNLDSMSAASAGGMGLAPSLGQGLGQELGQANLGAALTGSGYGLGAAFFAPLAFEDPMPPPPPPLEAENDTMFDFLRSPSPRRAAASQGLGPAQMQTLGQASLHFSQQMQSTPADAKQASQQSSAAAVSPPQEGPPQTQWG